MVVAIEASFTVSYFSVEIHSIEVKPSENCILLTHIVEHVDFIVKTHAMYRLSFPLSTINHDSLTKSHYKLASYINKYEQSKVFILE